MKPPGFWQYLKRAFTVQYNLILFGGALLAAVISGKSGFAYLGVAAEIVYLWAVLSTPSFRKLVDREFHEAMSRRLRESEEDIVQLLSPDERDRYQQVLDLCEEIRSYGQQRPAALRQVLKEELSKLDRFSGLYLRLLAHRRSIRRLQEAEAPEQIRRQIETLSGRAKNSGSVRIRESLETTASLKKERLRILEQATEHVELINVELDRIVEQLKLLRSRIMVQRDPGVFTDQIDVVAEELKSSEALLQDLEDFEKDFGAGKEIKPRALPPQTSR